MLAPRRAIRRLGAVVKPAWPRRHVAPFDVMTCRARDVFVGAQDEARRFGHDFIGTEHVLLGVLRRRDSVGAKLLDDMGVELEATRSAVESAVGRGPKTVVGERHLTPRLKRMLELAVSEAATLGHHYVGTEHLVIGIAGDGDGVAARILRHHGVTAGKVRAEVVRTIGMGSPR